jgi:hypothetical protein
MRVAFANQAAYGVIESESLRSPHRETGGLLIGRRILHAGQLHFVVLAATGPGYVAKRSTFYYASDVAYLQSQLEHWRFKLEQYDVDYIGEWHQHPPDFEHLSYADIVQAHQILNNPLYNLRGGGLLLPISFVDQGKFCLNCFHIASVGANPEHLEHFSGEDDVLKAFLGENLLLRNGRGDIRKVSAVT